GQELLQGTDIDAFAPSTSTYSTMYYPWVRSPNPLYNVDLNPTADKTVLVQPSAFAAGLWTKTDGRRGVWKAPAGVETRLVGASALQFEVEDLEQSVLNPRGINCYRKMPTYGPVVWGARTLATRAVPEWRYVPVRRTALFIEKSIKDGIQWAVFQGNAHPLWGSLRANIGGFMDGLFRAGAFQGETANDAYFVRCNLGDTMTQADIDRGQVIVVVGFAPLKPAEFVIVRIQQKVGEQ
ncbi:MAG: phage tail sheath C-terminal domain-containing protein, partial [Pseudomonadota bacterium]